MTILNRRKELLFWIPAALIPVALMVAVFIQVRRPTTTRRALYIIGEPAKGAALFLVTSNAAFAIPSMDQEAASPRISPESTPGLPQWGGL